MPETVVANSQRSITLPDEIWKEIDDLAIMQSGELTRELIMRGLRVYKSELAKAASYENSQLVNQKLKQRQGSMAEALKVLKAKVDGGDTEAADAIAAIEKGLSD